MSSVKMNNANIKSANYNNNNLNHINSNGHINNNSAHHHNNTGNQPFHSGAKNANKRNANGMYDYFRFNHNRLPFVVANEGKVAEMDLLPMPPQDNFFFDINTYEKNDFAEPEPRWNPDIHLRITEPEYVVRLD